MFRVFRDILAIFGIIVLALNIASYLDSIIQISSAMAEYFRGWEVYVELVWRKLSEIVGIPFWRPAAQPFAFAISFSLIALSTAPTTLPRIEGFFLSTLGLLRTLKQDGNFHNFKYDFRRVIRPFYENQLGKLFIFVYMAIILLAANSNSEASGTMWFLYLVLNVVVYTLLTLFLFTMFSGLAAGAVNRRLNRDQVLDEIYDIRSALCHHAEFSAFDQELEFDEQEYGDSEPSIDFF